MTIHAFVAAAHRLQPILTEALTLLDHPHHFRPLPAALAVLLFILVIPILIYQVKQFREQEAMR